MRKIYYFVDDLLYCLSAYCAQLHSVFAGVDDNGDNETIKTNSFGENEDKDHTNEDTISLGVSSNTGITSNTNS